MKNFQIYAFFGCNQAAPEISRPTILWSHFARKYFPCKFYCYSSLLLNKIKMFSDIKYYSLV
jgi:hypothetical protein